MDSLDPRTTALVLVDLQKGILGFPLAPHSGPSVLNAGARLAKRFRAAGAAVVLTRVSWSGNFADALQQPGRDEGALVPRDAAQDGGNREQRDADDEDPGDPDVTM